MHCHLSGFTVNANSCCFSDIIIGKCLNKRTLANKMTPYWFSFLLNKRFISNLVESSLICNTHIFLLVAWIEFDVVKVFKKMPRGFFSCWFSLAYTINKVWILHLFPTQLWAKSQGRLNSLAVVTNQSKRWTILNSKLSHLK